MALSRHSQRVPLVALGLLLLGACEFQTQVPSRATIPCDSTTACPAGFVCRPSLGRCVPDSLLQGAPAAVVDLAMQPTLGTATTTFTLELQVTAPLSRPPSASASMVLAQGSVATYPFMCGACSPSETCRCTFAPDPADLPPAGTYQVGVTIVDAVGNTPPTFAAPSLQLDYTPPQVIPPATIALTAPARVTTPVLELGPGVTAEVCFQVDKPLGATPEVWAAPGSDPDAGALAFSLASGYPVERSYCFVGTLGSQAPAADGWLQAWTVLTDEAGNTVRVALPLSPLDGGASLTIDFTPPPVPDTSAGSGLHYRRAPWGEVPTIGTPLFALTSPGAPIGKAGTLVAYADALGHEELARWPVASSSFPPLPLPAADHPEVWVTLIDRAGNLQNGGPVAVTNVDWVASLGRKVAGDLQANPHDCYAKTVWAPTLVAADDSSTALSAAGGPVGMDGGAVLISGGASWRARTQGVPDQSSMVTTYSPSEGMVMMMDGEDDTIAFNGRDWLFPAESVVPSARSDYALAYDRTRGRAVLFGGGDNTSTGNPLCDTWELSSSGWDLVQECLPQPDGGLNLQIPPARSYPCLGYDPDQHQTVLVGGVTPEGANAEDLWAWNGSAWTNLPTPDAGRGPSCLTNAIAYFDTPDAGSGLVMLGTSSADGGSGSATWFGRWEGTTYQWTMAVPPLPAWLVAQSLTIDPRTGQAVAALIDERADAGLGELWSWSGLGGDSWSERGTIPFPVQPQTYFMLVGHAAFPEDAESITVLDSGGNTSDATLICGLSPWICRLVKVSSSGLPFGALTGLAFDSAGNGVLAVGLADGSGTQALTWGSDQDWQAGPTGPSARGAGAFGYSPTAGAFLLFGGEDSASNPLNDAWSFAANAGWTELRTQTPGSQPRVGDSLIDVPDGGLAPGVVVAGSGGPPLLLTTASDGGLIAAALASSAPQGSMAYDPLRHRAVVAALNGTQIEEASAPAFVFSTVSDGPENPNFASVVADASDGGTLLVGGGPAFGSTLEGAVARWNGTSLQLVPLVDAEADGNPITDYQPTVALDPGAGRAMLVASNDDQNELGTWELTLADGRPALVCQFRFSAAGAAPGAMFTALQIEATGGAQGALGATSTQLFVWGEGGWQPVGSCSPPACTLAAPGALGYSITDSGAIAQALRDLDTLGVALSPGTQNGPGLAEVAAGLVQVEVSYRLPQ